MYQESQPLLLWEIGCFAQRSSGRVTDARKVMQEKGGARIRQSGITAQSIPCSVMVMHLCSCDTSCQDSCYAISQIHLHFSLQMQVQLHLSKEHQVGSQWTAQCRHLGAAKPPPLVHWPTGHYHNSEADGPSFISRCRALPGSPPS